MKPIVAGFIIFIIVFTALSVLAWLFNRDNIKFPKEWEEDNNDK